METVVDKKTATPEKLFGEFAPATYEQWKAAAEATLKGAPFDKKLCTMTPEGIVLQPIYNAADTSALSAAAELPGAGTTLRGTRASGYLKEGWQVAQELAYGTPQEFNEALNEDLMRGQTALNVVLDIASQKGIDPDSAQVGEVGACGLSVSSVSDLEVAFKDVVWSALPIYWQAGVSGVPLMAIWGAYLKKNRIQGKSLRGSYDLDPLTTWLRAGTLPITIDKALDELASALSWSQKNTPHMAVVGVQANTFADAGANAVQELADTLAATVEYVRQMQKRGIKPQTTLERVRWTFAVGPQYFTEVAKFRAARLLWASLLSGYRLSPSKIALRLHARTGQYHKTTYDAHNNILRGSMEAFAAVVGGVESLTVAAYDEVIGLPDAHSRRIARNSQIILREECGLDRLVDPAGGSYYVESLTAQLAAKAWEKFQCIEKAGGFVQAITTGETQKFIAATAAERAKRFGQRRDVLVGTNMYASVGEKPKSGQSVDFNAIYHARHTAVVAQRALVEPKKLAKACAKLETVGTKPSAKVVELAIEAASAGATIGVISKYLRVGIPASEDITPLPYTRLSAPYEALRALARHKAPKIFLATMGALRDHKVRADYIRGFVEAGGIEAIYPTGFADAAAAAQAAAQSGAKIAVICSTDELYPTLGPQVVSAIKSAAPHMQVYLAGQPATEHEAAYKAAGLDSYISARSPHLETLQKIVAMY